MTLHAQEAERAWTSADGKPLVAQLVDFDGVTVRLKLKNGASASVPLARLSEADQTYLAEWRKKQPIKVVMPDSVSVDLSRIKIEIIGEDDEKEEYVYRTNHFELTSQGKFSQSLAREVARSFEATYELLKALPWDIRPRPSKGDYFLASLFKDRRSYFNAGAPANSGGVYMSGQHRFMVPFESIGLRTFGSAYRMADDFDRSTLVHELTHQMMHFWLSYLPPWAKEGMAEYCSIIPLKNGTFRISAAKSGLRDYLNHLKNNTMGGIPEPYPLDKLFNVGSGEWNAILGETPGISRRLYFTSYLLVYFFMHMDGKGDGENFIRYLRASSEPKTQMETYEKALEEFKKLPEVEETADGSLRYPSTLKPPARPAKLSFAAGREELLKKNVLLLLNERTEAQLMSEVRTAYRKLGVRLE